jgi:phage tail sheath protein FI
MPARSARPTPPRAYRAQFGARELMLIWPDSSAKVAGDAVARALALRAAIDETVGWHKTISNVTVAGITTVTQDVHYDLLDNATDAGLLNDADITTIIRTSAGYRFWGNRTCAADDQGQYAFESAVRTLYALQDVIAETFSPFFDQPMTVGLVKDLLETVNARFRKYTLKGWVMGARRSSTPTATPRASWPPGARPSASSSRPAPRWKTRRSAW